MAFDTSVSVIDVAATSLATKRYFIVKPTSTGINLCGDGEKAAGVLYNKPGAGDPAKVKTSGACKVIAGGSVTRGDFVSSDTNGECVTAASGDYILGWAVEGAADGEIFTIQINQLGRVA